MKSSLPTGEGDNKLWIRSKHFQVAKYPCTLPMLIPIREIGFRTHPSGNGPCLAESVGTLGTTLHQNGDGLLEVKHVKSGVC